MISSSSRRRFAPGLAARAMPRAAGLGKSKKQLLI
jgi:hypothetical protein